ncbi:hypothetical protein IAD21_01061 [Abditibacteriota bacterium]|nr:hypothetical protein IAD21_01061 [Abditibacteriota bacterium]
MVRRFVNNLDCSQKTRSTSKHKSFKRTIKVALLLTTRRGNEHRVLLFSTDLRLAGQEIVRLYRARFQIESLFREAKSRAGLTHCQSRSQQTLHNPWNIAFAVVNLAKLTTQRVSAPFSFSSCAHKRRNVHFLQLVPCTLGLD